MSWKRDKGKRTLITLDGRGIERLGGILTGRDAHLSVTSLWLGTRIVALTVKLKFRSFETSFHLLFKAFELL